MYKQIRTNRYEQTDTNKQICANIIKQDRSEKNNLENQIIERYSPDI